MSTTLSSNGSREARLALAQAEMDAIHQFGLAIHAPRDPDALFRQLYDLYSRVIPSDASFIALYNRETGALHTRFRIDKGVEYPAGTTWRPSVGGPTEWVMLNAAPIRFNDFHRELAVKFPQAAIQQFGDGEVSRSWMAAPMLIDREFKGIVNVQSYRPNLYGPREERLLLTLGSMLAIAVENARLVGRLESWRQALSAPLIPVSKHLVILPLLGRLDQGRMEVVQNTLLSYVERERARRVLLDMTGVTKLEPEASKRLENLIRAVELLGAHCIISGLRPQLAAELALRGSRLIQLPVVRSVAQGLAQLRALS